MKVKYFVPALMIIAVVFSSCSTENTGLQEMNMKFDFSKDYQGWSYGVADYVAGHEQAIGFACKYSRLPQPLNTTKSALFLSAKNPGEGLFFFIKRQITGLKPMTKYEVEYNMELASNAPSETSANDYTSQDVFIKAGATTHEPKSIQNGIRFEMNLDKGNKNTDGVNAKMIGNIGNGTNQPTFTLMERNSANKKIEVVTDEDGNMWLILGFDAAYQARTTLFISYLNINVYAI